MVILSTNSLHEDLQRSIFIFFFKKMETQDENGIIYELNENDLSASVVRMTQDVKNIFITCFIEFGDKKYLITTVERYAISSRIDANVKFAEDSEVKIFKTFSFRGFINNIQIPTSLVNIKPNSFDIKYSNNASISVSKDNHTFSTSEDNHYPFGKIQNNLDYFDTLIYITPSVYEADIPSNIKIIKSYALSKCDIVNIPKDSQLETIEEFQSNRISKIIIPKGFKNFYKEFFHFLKEIEVSSEILFKKSD